MVFSLGFRFVYVQEVEKYFCNKKWKVVIHVAENCIKLYWIAEGAIAQQKALLRSRKFYCVAEGFAAQQKVLLHNRKFYYTAEGFTAQQKVLLHNKKVRPVAETREKFILWQK